MNRIIKQLRNNFKNYQSKGMMLTFQTCENKYYGRKQDGTSQKTGFVKSPRQGKQEYLHL